MPTTIGAYKWSTTRGVPAAGRLTLAADPIAGYGNILRASTEDDAGGDRTAELAAVAEGDTLLVIHDGVVLFRQVTGEPVVAPASYGFPFVIRLAFDEGDEPANDAEVSFLQVAAGAVAPEPGWPTTAELAQVLDVENVADWQTTLDRVLAAAIDATKGAVGDWDDGADAPDDNLAAAALRMAELMSQRPDATVVSLTRDASFRAYMAGKHRRFGFA